MTTNGCDHSVLIALLMACILIVCMLVIGSKMRPYAQEIDEIAPEIGAFYRLNGRIVGETVCGQTRCLACDFSQVRRPLDASFVIVEGRWQGDVLRVTQLLTRCGHP